MTPAETVNAKKQAYKDKDALKVLAGVDEIFAAKGKKVVHMNLKKDRPEDDKILEVLIGPTGNLRAPTIKRGRKLLVGFDEETYKQVLGG